MKKKNFLWSLLTIVMAATMSMGLSSCGDDDDPVPEMKVAPDSASFEATGGSTTINVTATDTEWDAEVTNGGDWLTVTNSKQSFTIKADPNKKTSQRSGTVMVKATADAKLNVSISVTQKGADAEILVNGQKSASLEFEGLFQGQSPIIFKQTVNSTSNVNWSISDVPEWLSVSPTSGSGDVQIGIYPKTENEKSAARTAEITLSGNGATATISVIQDGGRANAKLTPMNMVALYDQIAWELQKSGNVNKYQMLVAVEDVYNRKTEKELLEDLQYDDAEKFYDDYTLYFYSKDSYGNYIYPNTTYYICTVAYDDNDNMGEIIKTKVTTPAYSNADDDAWVSVSDVRYYNSMTSFEFTATKEGYCDTYHVVYGNLPSNFTFPRSAFVFQINYFLKNNKKHWLAKNYNMEIVTNYPNTHTFLYNTTTSLTVNPLITICTWGVFKNGKTSSDAMLFRGDVSDQSRVTMVPRNERTRENIIITPTEFKTIPQKFLKR